MDIKASFGRALKKVRTSKKITQEDFSDVSSRTYVSSLERGKKSVTLEKLDELADVLGVHPATLVLMTYQDNQKSTNELISLIQQELEEVEE